MGTVLRFPTSAGGRFDEAMRDALARFAARTPGVRPLSFGEAADGSEFCRFGNGLTVGWDGRHRLILTDTLSGYVDDGPFGGLGDILSVIEYLSA